MQEREVAIQVSHLTKKYKLFMHNRDRVLDALGLGGKKPRYTEKLALRDVDMTIYRGETVGIIGTNGSGKSTILKVITGVLTPTEGEVQVNGRISALLELGAGFNMEYNGIENIYLNGTMIGFSKKEIDERLDAILEFADIGEYVYQPVKMYSSGMFMRLAFAVAINIDPEILIVDEALAVGDVFFQAKCFRKFDEFKKAGKTVLFVSHDMSSIGKYCDRVVLLNRGVKLDEGAPKEMIDIYKRVLVGQYDPKHPNASPSGSDPVSAKAANAPEGASGVAAIAGEGAPKEASGVGAGGAVINPELLEYGSNKARITAVDILDDTGVSTSSILKGAGCTIRMQVEFYEDVEAPIFAFTIKNKQGTEITGTNTMFEKTFLEPVSKGEVKTVTFHQCIDLQGGEYLISFGCTGYEGTEFTVYHRLYDLLNLTVVSDKDTVGFYDMNSRVEVF